MSHILTPLEFAESLGLAAVTDRAVSALEDAEALFEAATNRTDAPFRAAQPGRVETHDGTGMRVLYLEYPIGTLTSVKLGYDPTSPVETLAVNDQSVLNWKAGDTRLVRIGGVFGGFRQPNYVQVTYDTQSDVPDAVRAAIKAGGAYIYTSSAGASGDVRSETFGPWSVTYDVGSSGTTAALGRIPAWTDAVNAYRRMVVA